MLNHAGDDKNIAFDSHKDKEKGLCFKMYAQRDIKRGEELTDSYGNECNFQLFYTYGFVLTGNEHNKASFDIPFNPEDPLLEEKEKLIGYKTK